MARNCRMETVTLLQRRKIINRRLQTLECQDLLSASSETTLTWSRHGKMSSWQQNKLGYLNDHTHYEETTPKGTRTSIVDNTRTSATPRRSVSHLRMKLRNSSIVGTFKTTLMTKGPDHRTKHLRQSPHTKSGPSLVGPILQEKRARPKNDMFEK